MPPDLRIRLYAFTGSNACLSSQLLLDYAGVEYEQVTLKPGIHALSLRLRGFPGTTVPALSIEDRKLVGSRRIASTIAELVPDAGLLPTDGAATTAVLAAERSGERLQNAMRRVMYVAAQSDRASVRNLVDVTYASWPAPARTIVTRALVPLASKAHRAKPARALEDVARISDLLDEFDALVTDGVLGGERPNIADFQIAPNVVALSELRGELGEQIRTRPIGIASLRLLNRYPVELDLQLPEEWTAQLLH